MERNPRGNLGEGIEETMNFEINFPPPSPNDGRSPASWVPRNSVRRQGAEDGRLTALLYDVGSQVGGSIKRKLDRRTIERLELAGIALSSRHGTVLIMRRNG